MERGLPASFHLRCARHTGSVPPMRTPPQQLVLGARMSGDFEVLDADERRRHLYVIGQTGTGKSTLLLNLIAQDLAAGVDLGRFQTGSHSPVIPNARRVGAGLEPAKIDAGGEVLRDEVEEQRGLAGAGLADDVKMPAPFVGIEHLEIARHAGTENELLWLQVSWAERSRCAVRIAGGMTRAAPVP